MAREQPERRKASQGLPPVIRLEHVTKTFPAAKGRAPIAALADVSATVYPSEVVAIPGPSGSGKSTLLRSVNGLERIDSGRIEVDSVQVGARRADMNALRARVGMVFQDFNLFLHKTCSKMSSCLTEIANGAIRAVPRGQEEAARSVGMNKLQAYWHVVLPQALRLTIPAMSGVYVIIIKSTAILSVVGIADLTRQGEITTLRFPGDILLIYLCVAAFYFVYGYPVLRFTDWAEQRVGGTRLSQE